MHKARFISLVFSLMPLAACGSGTAVDENKYQSLIVGKTTMEETIALLGQPDTRSFQQDDIILGYQATRINPLTYIPIASMFRDDTARGQQCMFQFSKMKILQHKTCAESAVGAGELAQ